MFTHKKTITRRAVAAAASMTLLLGITACGSDDDKGTPAGTTGGTEKAISFDYGLVTADQYAVYVAQDLDLFKKHGLNPKFTPFQSGSLLLSALKSNSVDVASIGLGAVFALGQNTPLKVHMWDVNSSSAVALVSKNKDVQSFRDIKKAGKIGVATGSCAQVALYDIAKAAGASYGDLDVANIPPAQARNALMGGGIDTAVAWAPFGFQIADSGTRIVNYGTDWPPEGGPCPSFVVSRGNYDQGQEVARRLVAVQADALKAIEADTGIAIKALQNRLNVDESVAKRMFERVWDKRPTYEDQVSPTSPYSIASKTGLAGTLKHAAQAFADLKVIPKPIPDTVIDAAMDPAAVQAFIDGEK